MNDHELVRRTVKADHHTHIPLAASFADFVAEVAAIPVPPNPTTLRELERYITTHLTPHLKQLVCFERAVALGFRAATRDNVRVIAATLSVAHARKYGGSIARLVTRVRQLADANAPGCRLRLYAGIRREYGVRHYDGVVDQLAGGGFDGIDLTGDESAAAPDCFRALFEQARRSGLRRRAHCGEHGTADDVLRTVEVLDLREIQHGIVAGDSAAARAALATAAVVLNIAPASNYALLPDPATQNRRIRALLESGVRITVGTDDLLLFHRTITDQVVDLERAGVISRDGAEKLLRAGIEAW